MCAINPKHQTSFIIKVYTSDLNNQGEAVFLDLVMEKILQAEIELNRDARLRWHVEATE